jgi:hypothetical protein
MTHPNTKKLYEVRFWMSVFCVLSSDQAAVPAPSFNRVFELFFLNEMSRRTDTHCQLGKNTGPHTPNGGVGTKDKYKGRGGGGGKG